MNNLSMVLPDENKKKQLWFCEITDTNFWILVNDGAVDCERNQWMVIATLIHTITSEADFI